MKHCPCHHNDIDGSLPTLDGIYELAGFLADLFAFIDSHEGFDHDFIRGGLDQAEQLARSATEECRTYHESPVWLGFGRDGSILHACTRHRDTVGEGYTWLGFG